MILQKTLPVQKNISEVLSWITLIIFTIFFFKIVYPVGTLYFFFDFIIIFFILTSLYFKKIFITKELFAFCTIPFIFITLNEYIFHSNSDINSFKIKHYPPYLYTYLLLLLLLPTIIINLKIKINTIYILITLSCIFSLILNTYINIIENFDRVNLVARIDTIIIYDYAIVCLSLFPLVYSFFYKSKISYLIIILSLLNILTICLHGTRGIWIGIPLILLTIFITYYKKQSKKVIFSCLFCLFLGIIGLFTPASPIQSRIAAFKSDISVQNTEKFNESSTGLRVLMYKEFANKFQENPLYGVGTEKLEKQLILKIKQPHLHNLFIQELATHGIFGFIGMFTLIFFPLFIFTSTFFKKNINELQKNIAVTGICITLFTFICGLTDYTFVRNYSLFIYSLLIVLLFTYNSLLIRSCDKPIKEA